MDNKGVFDTLNEALFAQMDKLQSIDPRDKDQMEQSIAQSRCRPCIDRRKRCTS